MAAQAHDIEHESRRAFLSSLTGGGKWVSVEVDADRLYQRVLLRSSASSGDASGPEKCPHLYGAEPPKAKHPIVRVIDMIVSNAWGEHAVTFARTRATHAEHERAKEARRFLIAEEGGGVTGDSGDGMEL